MDETTIEGVRHTERAVPALLQKVDTGFYAAAMRCERSSCSIGRPRNTHVMINNAGWTLVAIASQLQSSTDG
jgi:hypothetical protein